ncbi:MAG: hypothetical protein ABI345_15170 [Jatrophihabitans sp.]
MTRGRALRRVSGTSLAAIVIMGGYLLIGHTLNGHRGAVHRADFERMAFGTVRAQVHDQLGEPAADQSVGQALPHPADLRCEFYREQDVGKDALIFEFCYDSSNKLVGKLYATGSCTFGPLTGNALPVRPC